jgi:hypothetical protein
VRVVCPFTNLRHETEAALCQHAPHAELIDVSGSVYAYWELLRDLGAEGRDFFVVEARPSSCARGSRNDASDLAGDQRHRGAVVERQLYRSL